MPDKDLDQFDLAILAILQADNKTPQRQIADQVNLSPAAVQRRVASLESRGVIRANVAVLNAEAISAAITVIVEVHLMDDRSTTVDPAKKIFAEAAHVQQCYFVTGNGGFILVMIVPDMKTYERVSRELFADNGHVLTFRTLVVLDAVKVGLELNLPVWTRA